MSPATRHNPHPSPAAGTVRSLLEAEAIELGFDRIGIVSPLALEAAGERLREFLRLGRHGDMEWMTAHAARRADPRALWPEARSAVMLAMSYAPDEDPLVALGDADHGTISVYAQGGDYHDIMKPRLKRIAGRLQQLTGGEVKVFVDTAPLMEKPLAALAGLGWQGKHTNLVSRELGSWFFLGAILTTADLDADAPEIDHCGTCRRCLDVCPTNAFPTPYTLDARRCISYLTIEHKGHIPRELRAAMGNRIYGCDDCLAVCPWNKFAARAREQGLLPRDASRNPPLRELLQLDDAAFRKRFAGSPIKRTGRDRLVRNALIAAGNSGDAGLLSAVEPLLADPSEVVRAAAVWAIGQLADRQAIAQIEARHRAIESRAEVLAEWEAGDGP